MKASGWHQHSSGGSSSYDNTTTGGGLGGECDDWDSLKKEGNISAAPIPKAKKLKTLKWKKIEPSTRIAQYLVAGFSRSVCTGSMQWFLFQTQNTKWILKTI